MREEVLKKEQIDLLPLLSLFKKEFYLVGGTAVALHIGHRYSIDYDLFTYKNLKIRSIKNLLKKNNYVIQHVLFEDSEQLHCIINNVKVTFFQFPFKIEAITDFKDIIKIPDLLSLSAMKSYALGRRGKWKDYVDLYFIFKNYYSYEQVVDSAKLIFKDSFNEKLFKQQLSYFDDVSFTEEVEYLDEPIPEQEIKDYLTEIALRPF